MGSRTGFTQVRTAYVPPGSRSILEKRLPRRLKVGETRPPIYYKFDCVVELSDGSTVTRRSQFPKVEWRYLADNRTNPRWNPTRKTTGGTETDSAGRVAKFKQKFGFFDEQPGVEAESEKKDAKADKAKDSDKADVQNDAFEMDDLLGENVVPVQSGGRVATKRRPKRK